MRTSPPHACTPARPDPRSSNGPAGRRTERGRFFTEPALHFHLQLFPHRPESCSVHERGDHAPQPLHGGIPMSALVPDELRNPFLRTLLGKRQNPEFIRARDFTRKRLGTGQAEVGTPHHLHGAEEVRRSHRTRPCDPGLGNRRVHCPKHPFGARSDFHVSVRKTLFERECARLVEPSGQRMTASHDEHAPARRKRQACAAFGRALDGKDHRNSRRKPPTSVARLFRKSRSPFWSSTTQSSPLGESLNVTPGAVLEASVTASPM